MARNPPVDIQDVAGAPASATNPIPVRLSDGTSFYVASGGAGGGGAITTSAKGTTLAGSPTATDIDANRTALDVYVRGGGAGGGAATIADGADVAEGATTDVAWVSGAGSLIAISKAEHAKLEAIRALLAGSIAVTGTFWQATQPVSGPLTDTQLRASAVPVSGPLTDTQLRASAVPVSMATQTPDVTDRAGRLVGVVSGGANVFHVDDNAGSMTVDAPVGTPLFARLSDGAAALIGQKVMASSLPVALASDQSALAVTGPLTDTQLRASNVPVVTRPVTTGGLTIFRLLAAATTNASSVKGSAGQVYGWYLFNTSAATKYVKLYNKATAPTVGTDTPVMTLPLPAGSAANVYFEDGIAFATGIALAITGAVADADTTAVAANDVIVNLFYF
jgi:hypothetical protein